MVIVGLGLVSPLPAFADHAGDLQGASEALGRVQQNLSQDNFQLQQDYQKLREDKRSGADLIADQQAIQSHKQALKNDRSTYQSTALAYQELVNGPAPQNSVVPNNGNQGWAAPGGKWDHGSRGDQYGQDRSQRRFHDHHWRNHSAYGNNWREDN